MSTTTRVRSAKPLEKTSSADSITPDPRGVAYIAGTTMKVRQIVMEAQRLYQSAEEIQRDHAHDGLTLSQVHTALDYYESNKPSIDAEIEAEDKFIAEARKSGYRPNVEELRAKLKQQQSN